MNDSATVLCFLSLTVGFSHLAAHAAAAVDTKPRLIYRSQDAAAVYTAAGGCLQSAV